MVLRSRSLLLALASVGYVVLASMRSAPGREWGIFVLLALPPLLIVAWARSLPPARGEDWVHPATRRAVRAAAFGGALLAAARIAPAGTAPFEAIAMVGTTTACTASLVALAYIAPYGGLLAVPEAAKR